MRREKKKKHITKKDLFCFSKPFIFIYFKILINVLITQEFKIDKNVNSSKINFSLIMCRDHCICNKRKTTNT